MRKEDVREGMSVVLIRPAERVAGNFNGLRATVVATDASHMGLNPEYVNYVSLTPNSPRPDTGAYEPFIWDAKDMRPDEHIITEAIHLHH